MRHAATRALYDYWRGLLPPPIEGRQNWPPRAAIQPVALRDWLGDVFILHAENGEVRYRLAGTRLCELYGAELAGRPFLRAFDDAAGRGAYAPRSWSSTFGTEPVPLLFATRAFDAHEEEVALETLILPLADEGEQRALGITTPKRRPAWAGQRPITRQRIEGVRVLRPWEQGLAKRDWPVLAPVVASPITSQGSEMVLPGRRVGHLRVLQGGLG